MMKPSLITGIVPRLCLWTGLLSIGSCAFIPLNLNELPQNLNVTAVEQIKKAALQNRDFSFAVMGDSRGNPEQFQQVLTKALEKKPAFIIHTGDLTSRGRYRHYYRNLKIIRELPVPFIVVPGNHDFNNRGKNWFSRFFGPMDVYFDAGGYRFICADNNDAEVAAGFLELPARNQQKSLSQLIAGTKPIIILMHIPPPLPLFAFHSFEGDSQTFMKTVAANEAVIRGVFCGHIHGYGEAFIGKVPCVATGGGGARLVQGREGIIGRHHFLLVTIKGHTVQYQPFFVE